MSPTVPPSYGWSEAQLFEPDEARSTLLHRGSGLPVRRMEVLAPDGRVLQAGDTVVRKVAANTEPEA